jgi:hypothetical protein
MVWRIDLIYVSGTHGLVATPYETEADALAAIKAEWDRGTIQSASMEDHRIVPMLVEIGAAGAVG